LALVFIHAGALHGEAMMRRSGSMPSTSCMVGIRYVRFAATLKCASSGSNSPVGMSSSVYGCSEKSEAPMVSRAMLKSSPGGGPNSSSSRAWRAGALSLFCSSQAEASVTAAPKPTMVW